MTSREPGDKITALPRYDERVASDSEPVASDVSGEHATAGVDNILSIIWAWRKSILVAAALSATAAGISTLLFVTPIYTAKSQLMLDASDPAVIDIENVAPDTRFPADLRGRESLVQSATVILTGTPLLHSVVQDLKLDDLPEFNPRLRESGPLSAVFSKTKSMVRSLLRGSRPAVDGSVDKDVQAAIVSLHSALTVEPVGNSLVIEVSADSEDPALAARIANAVVDNYISRQIAQKHEAALQATEWLKNRADKLRGDVTAAEREIERFNAALTASGLRSVEVLKGIISKVPGEINTVKSEIADLMARRDAIERLTAEQNLATVAEIVRSPILNDLRQRLSDTNAAIDRLEAQYGSNPPGAKSLLDIRTQIMDRIVGEIDQILNGLEALISINQARAAALESDLRDAEDEMNEQAVEQLKLRELEREADSTRAVYNQFLLRLKEATERSGLQDADSTVVARAEPPNRPSRPKVGLIALIFGVFGGAGMLAVATMRKTMRSTVITEADVRACTGLQMIGNIPRAQGAATPGKGPKAARALNVVKGLTSAKGLNLAQLPTEPTLVSGQVLDQMCERPFSALSESVRWLHMALRPDNRTESQVIVLTSAIPGEGKSTLSLMLARASAETGKSTLLIDADRVRSPELRAHATFVAQRSPRETHGFDIITAEAIGSVDASGDAVQWLKSDALCDKVLRKCRTRYQTIIIDAPPALSISDAVILGRAADQVAVVCEWGATPQGSLRQCVHHLWNCGIAPRGVVLNKVDLLRQAQETFAGAEYALNRTMSYYSDVAEARPDRT